MKTTIIYLLSFLLLHLHLSNAILPPSPANKSYTTTSPPPPSTTNKPYITTSPPPPSTTNKPYTTTSPPPPPSTTKKPYTATPPPPPSTTKKPYTTTPPPPPSTTKIPYITTPPPPPSTTNKPYTTTPPPPPSTTNKPYITTPPPPPSTTNKPYITTPPPPPSTTNKPYITTPPPPPSTTNKPYITTPPPPPSTMNKPYPTNPPPPPSTTNKPYITPPPPQNGNIEFIKTSCQKTLYRDICFNSLKSYANKINQDPSKLAIVAIKVSLSKAKKMANYVSNLSRQADYGAEPRIAAALHDCFSVFGDAVESMNDSLKQMSQLTGQSIRFQMSNVQTWMSAAMTDEDTCTDGLAEAPDGPVKSDVIIRVDNAMHVTSNALALINSFVEKITTP